MATMFDDEAKFSDNKKRENFVFLGYPFTPPVAQADYLNALKELETEVPIRLWCFLDEITTQELMRKIWRAILRSDLCFFDISGGNPNVALELGLALAAGKSCITLLKTGEPNPLGGADLGYSERVEYSSVITLKEKIRSILKSKSSALRKINEISYHVQSDVFNYGQEEILRRTTKIVNSAYQGKRITKKVATGILGDNKQATIILNTLREFGIFKIEGQKKGAKWVLGDSWVTANHEVVGGE